MDVRFHGNSMLPFVRDGDRLIVEPVVWREIARGDLVTYRFEDKFPTRRVARKGRNSILLWCDNWPDRRFRARRHDVLGRVVTRERDGARLHASDDEWRAATERSATIFRRWRVRRTLVRLHIIARSLGWLRRPARQRV
ncbi:MAG TPA: S24/S26 family peptidase [Candidatus Methylomirabilis sp.]|nr:S24/S26 family peptidase [Candidatus Methylomirabilis sp.]